MCGAGMRLGYIVSNPELINTVTTVKNSVNHFPIDAVNQVTGVESCKEFPYYAECAKKVVTEREDFQKFLTEKGFEVIESKTNFVMEKHPDFDGHDLSTKIKKQGINVRHFATKGIEKYLRITIGTHSQMEELKKAIENIL